MTVTDIFPWLLGLGTESKINIFTAFKQLFRRNNPQTTYSLEIFQCLYSFGAFVALYDMEYLVFIQEYVHLPFLITGLLPLLAVPGNVYISYILDTRSVLIKTGQIKDNMVPTLQARLSQALVLVCLLRKTVPVF